MKINDTNSYAKSQVNNNNGKKTQKEPCPQLPYAGDVFMTQVYTLN